VTDRELLEREAARLLPGGAGLPAASELDLVWPDELPPGAVGDAFGYPGPRSIPLPPLPDARDHELEPLLERVRARGPIYRGAGGCEPPQGYAGSS
jgi:hypothetical protein